MMLAWGLGPPGAGTPRAGGGTPEGLSELRGRTPAPPNRGRSMVGSRSSGVPPFRSPGAGSALGGCLRFFGVSYAPAGIPWADS